MAGAGAAARQRLDLASTLGILRSLLIYRAQPWRIRAHTRFYRRLLRPGELAFDIGAHVGSRSRAMRAAGARVVAVEPQPALASYLARTLAGDDVTVVASAVGREAGFLDLRISRRHPTVSTGSAAFVDAVAGDESFAGVRWDRTERVPVTTLDRLIEKHGVPRLVKIDVEGMEPEILAGLSRPVPVVAFEYVPAAIAIAEAALARLAEIAPAYRFNFVVGESTRFISEDWLPADEAGALLRGLAGGNRHGDVYAVLSGDRLLEGAA